jgi:hypothetical protein
MKEKKGVLMTFIVTLFVTTAFGFPTKNNLTIDKVAIHDSLVIKKLNQQNTRDIINIDPNPSHGLVHVENTSKEIKEVQFYVFDLDGVMIENLRLIANERKKISELNKGTYLYEVFNKDESIERGKIIVE